MKKVTKAVIGCKTTEYLKLNIIACNVKEKMIENAAEFPGTSLAVNKLKNDQLLFEDLILTSKGNSAITAQRNEQAKTVHEDLRLLLDPVNVIAAGNEGTIGLSGFPSSLDPTPQPIPDRVMIRKVTPGKTELSAKLYIESLKLRYLMFRVRVTTVPGATIDDPSWKEVLRTSSSYKLVLTDLIRLETIYISVNAYNKHGEGIYSEPIRFTAI